MSYGGILGLALAVRLCIHWGFDAASISTGVITGVLCHWAFTEWFAPWLLRRLR